MKQQAFHTSHYPITGISRESLLIFCLKNGNCSASSQLQTKTFSLPVPKLPSISSAGDLSQPRSSLSLRGTVSTPLCHYLFLLPVFKTNKADITIVGFFSFVKVFVDTRIKSSEQSGIKGAKCFLPQHLLPNIVNASQFQTVRKLLFYLVLPVCRILHVS